MRNIGYIFFALLLGLNYSCYEEFSYFEPDWDKKDAKIMLNGEEFTVSVRSVTFKENPVYQISVIFFIDGLRYHARIDNIPKSPKKVAESLNDIGEYVYCEKNCAIVYANFEEHDVGPSATYVLDSTRNDHFVILEDANRKEISISFKMKLLRTEDGNPDFRHLGLDSIDLEGKILDIPLRRFE